MSKQEAMQGYIDEIKNIIETMPHNEFVDRLVKAIGPFYEFVDEDGTIQNESDSDNEEKENEVEIASINNMKSLNEMNSSQSLDGMTNSYDMMASASFDGKKPETDLNNGQMLNNSHNGFELTKSLLINSDDLLTKNNGEILQNGIPTNGTCLNGNGLHNTTGEKKNTINRLKNFVFLLF